jgi:hypothetical protein
VGWGWGLSSIICCPCPALTAYHFTSYSSAHLADWKLTLKLADLGFQTVAPHGLTMPVLAFHSFHSLSYDRSKASSKAGSHTVRSRANSFILKHPLISLRLSSSCLLLHPHLSITSILPSIFPSTTWFRRQVLCKMWLIQLAFLLFYVGYSCPPWLCVIVLDFFTQLIWMIFSILLQDHILACSSYIPPGKEGTLLKLGSE